MTEHYMVSGVKNSLKEGRTKVIPEKRQIINQSKNKNGRSSNYE